MPSKSTTTLRLGADSVECDTAAFVTWEDEIKLTVARDDNGIARNLKLQAGPVSIKGSAPAMQRIGEMILRGLRE